MSTQKKPEKKMLPMKDIQVLGEFQSRANGINKERAAQIGDAYRRQDPIPPVTVYRIVEDGHAYNGMDILAEGFHRFEGRNAAGYKDIEANVFTGTYGEAMRHAAMSNKEHDTAGLPRTNKDKARAVLMFCRSFKDLPKKDWPANRTIAEIVKVSHQHVNNMDPFGRADDVPEGERGIIKDRSIEKNAARRKGKKSAVEVYDWKGLDEAYCYVARAIDIIAEQHGIDQKTDKHFKAAFEGLDMIGAAMKAWNKKFGHKPTDTAEDYERKAKEAKEAAKKDKGKKEDEEFEKEPKKKAAAKAKPTKKEKKVEEPEPVEPDLPADEAGDEFDLVDEGEK
jgi:hypothetical protein